MFDFKFIKPFDRSLIEQVQRKILYNNKINIIKSSFFVDSFLSIAWTNGFVCHSRYASCWSFSPGFFFSRSAPPLPFPPISHKKITKVFKKWAPFPQNMVILPGYCVVGTVGHKLLKGRSVSKKIEVEKVFFFFFFEIQSTHSQ